MAQRLNMLFLVTIALAVLLQNSAAQTNYTVGDSSGWSVPTGGATFYSNWAANKTFRVGDTLVFNFASGRHDVAGLSKADFDACNTANTLFSINSAPASVVLNSTGQQYYICTFPGHCSGGQKLAINVSDATPSPAPQPSSPAPRPASPSPGPSATPAPSSNPTPPAPAPSSNPTPSAPAPSVNPTPPAPAPRPESSPPPPSPASQPPDFPPPPTPATPPPTSSTPPPPPGSSATSLGVAGLSATLLSLFVAVFLC